MCLPSSAGANALEHTLHDPDPVGPNNVVVQIRNSCTVTLCFLILGTSDAWKEETIF